MNKTIIYYSGNREKPEMEQKVVDGMMSNESSDGLTLTTGIDKIKSKDLPYWGNVNNLRNKFL